MIPLRFTCIVTGRASHLQIGLGIAITRRAAQVDAQPLVKLEGPAPVSSA